MGCGIAGGAGLAAIQVFLKVSFGQRQSRWATINNRAQRQTVTFAKGGNRKQLANGVARHAKILNSIVLPRLRSEECKLYVKAGAASEPLLGSEQLFTAHAEDPMSAALELQPREAD